MLAHVLSGSPFPVAGQWAAAAALFGGLVMAVIAKRRLFRSVALTAATLGFAATAIAWVLAAVQPGSPPYSLRIASPPEHAAVPPALVLTVCGVRSDGSLVAATDPQHYLAVFVDGKEIPTVDSWRIPVSLRLGRHTIRVELVTPQHHAFSPPASASVDVTATANAVSSRLESC